MDMPTTTLGTSLTTQTFTATTLDPKITRHQRNTSTSCLIQSTITCPTKDFQGTPKTHSKKVTTTICTMKESTITTMLTTTAMTTERFTSLETMSKTSITMEMWYLKTHTTMTHTMTTATRITAMTTVTAMITV